MKLSSAALSLSLPLITNSFTPVVNRSTMAAIDTDSGPLPYSRVANKIVLMKCTGDDSERHLNERSDNVKDSSIFDANKFFGSNDGDDTTQKVDNSTERGSNDSVAVKGGALNTMTRFLHKEPHNGFVSLSTINIILSGLLCGVKPGSETHQNIMQIMGSQSQEEALTLGREEAERLNCPEIGTQGATGFWSNSISDQYKTMIEKHTNIQNLGPFEINQWGRDHSDGMIAQLFDPTATPDNELVDFAFGAVATFAKEWTIDFEKRSVEFRGRNVSGMFGTVSCRGIPDGEIDGNRFRAVALPYKSQGTDNVSAVLIQPESMSDFTKTDIDQVLNQVTSVEASIFKVLTPIFDLQTQHNLISLLPNASVDCESSLKELSIFQSGGLVRFNEHGTKVAAFSRAGATRSASSTELIRIDGPFLLILCNEEEGKKPAPMMLGLVRSPSVVKDSN